MKQSRRFKKCFLSGGVKGYTPDYVSDLELFLKIVWEDRLPKKQIRLIAKKLKEKWK